MERTREATAALARMRRLDDGRALLAIAVDYGIIFTAIAMAILLHHPLADLVAVILIAGRQVALLNLVHAASHAALFRTRSWNRGLQLLYAWPILDAVDIYRGPHLDHHQAILEERDDRFEFLHGELELLERGAWGRTWIIFIRPLLGHASWSFTKTIIASVRAHRMEALRIACYWAVLIGGCLFFGWLPLLLKFWVLPLFWLHPAFLLWGEVSDHFGAATGTRNHTGLFHSVLINGHALYHDVHHRFPFVPFYGERAAFDWLRAHDHRMETKTSALGLLQAVYQAEGESEPVEMKAAISAS